MGLREAAGGRPGKVLLVLAAVFTAATVGALVLVAVDLVIGRPAAGNLFIAFLNGAAALVLGEACPAAVSARSPGQAGHEEGPGFSRRFFVLPLQGKLLGGSVNGRRC